MPPKTVRTVLPHQFSRIEIHHSATEITSPITAVRSFQRVHMNTNKWNDIFYNWLVHPDGTILEGRGWGTSARAENYMMFCLIGNYDTDQVTDAQKVSVEWLRNAAIARMPQLGTKNVGWHNDRDATACPGKHVVTWIKQRNTEQWATTQPTPTETAVNDEHLDDIDELTELFFELDYKAKRLQNKAQVAEEAAAVLEERTLAALRRARAIRNRIQATS